MSRAIVAVMIGVAALGAGPAFAAEDEQAPWVPIPFRVRNLTFPSLLVLGFKPAPAFSVPRGAWAVELDAAASNNFQMSSGIEDYFAERGGPRRPLDNEDVEGIVRETSGDQFLVDGEITIIDLGLHYGLTDHLDISFQISHLAYNGGFLDPVIWGFHDAFGFSQAGREHVADGSFQIFFVGDGSQVVLLDRPTSGGFSDPMVSLRWVGPSKVAQWSWGLEVGLKVPMASQDEWLSTGSLDLGAQLTAQRQWGRDSLVLNLALVIPGEFNLGGAFEPPSQPSLNAAWIRRIGRRTSAVLQVLASENIFRDVTDSALAEIELQVTAGLAWEVAGGQLGVAFTENLFNYDNTPDIAFRLSYCKVLL